MSKQSVAVLAVASNLLATAIFTSALAGTPIPIKEGVLQMGRIQSPVVTESSGLIASRFYPGVIWTHNDSDEYLVAMTRKGVTLGSYVVYGVHMADFEDIAADGAGNLYLGDIGDNHKTNRQTLVIYKVPEPNPYANGTVTVTRRYYVSFPGEPTDCESLVISRGFGYIITKQPNAQYKVTMYRFPLDVRSSIMQPVAEIAAFSHVTAADLSRDRNRLAVLTRNGAFCYFLTNRDITSVSTNNFVFTSFANTYMEGATFAGTGLLVSAETRELYLFNDPAFRSW